jgi:predicted DsbA family dithiol-disulfide isomerase
LMKAYFEEGVDLTKQENLISIAEKVGLDPNQISSLLNSDRLLADVTAAEHLNYQRGISGVPYYIVNNQYGISGAQATEVFVEALTQIGYQPITTEGDACAVDDPTC